MRITCESNQLTQKDRLCIYWNTVDVDDGESIQNEIIELMSDSLEYGNDTIVEIQRISGWAVS
jgi:hypothetical protein